MSETLGGAAERAVQALVAARVALASSARTSRPADPTELLSLVDEALASLQGIASSDAAYVRLGTFIEPKHQSEPDDLPA